ncbi:uncharacterized protein LOC127279582 isoform X1 [Leptopilina boulardi]|uniref:uncharacterized protein LOC127279582 isoform X1 n=1 Tax=Leptopilina boulardi TaxID=63433 RepID=UPI0021F5B398|nr:uncharacterized protein LOC127279582 isoform X1 [Leptopilina boulardi]XP_051157972.1 uncharacterized protein LOC127279582 isoform X1 [Leptopilina boulardi]
MKVDDVEDLQDKYLVSVIGNKNDYAVQFIIGKLFYVKVQNYVALRPAGQFSDRFFVRYQDGKCFRQVIGRHKIGEVPEKIAFYLELPNAKKYTRHCFRRSAATLLSDSGGNMQMVKQLGRWRSDLIAQGYLENSMHNRQLIFDGIIQKSTTNPSDKAQVTIEPLESECNLNWNDFSDDSGKAVISEFTTANRNPIILPVVNQNNGSSKLFSAKPGIKLKFKNQSTVQPPKSEKSFENLDNQNRNDINSALKKHDLKFENCTFNNCVFNVTSCNCNKENNL